MSGAPGAFIAGCAGLTLSPDEAAFFREANPWGFILFDRNVSDPAQLRALTDDLRAAVGRDAIVAIDQEGGRVQRMRGPHWREWAPPLEEVAHAGARAQAVMRLRYSLIAAELRGVGIDTNCAPCADIARSHTHPVLLNRCYGQDAASVSAVAHAVAQGLLENGVLPVLKHIPGHGAATADSHEELPVVPSDRAVLQDTDFAPFRALAALPMAMTGHVVFPAIDTDAPATLSPAVINVIRHQIGFDGLLMTDDISMGALAGDMATRCRAALDAGCDLILHCNGDMAEMTRVAAEAGPMPAGAVQRADAALGMRKKAARPMDELADEWAALTRAGAL